MTGWVLARPLRQPRTGTNQRDPRISQSRKESSSLLDDLPPLAGVKLVRPRRCAAPGAPAGPWPRGGKTGQLRGKIQKNSQPSPAAAHSHRARSVCPLDNGGPYGCRNEDVISLNTFALICIANGIEDRQFALATVAQGTPNADCERLGSERSRCTAERRSSILEGMIDNFAGHELGPSQMRGRCVGRASTARDASGRRVRIRR